MIVIGFRVRDPELHWDWTGIDQHQLNIPDGFVWGTATAAHQVEGGCDNNNRHEWELSIMTMDYHRSKKGAAAGIGRDHWNRYQNDIELMKELGRQILSTFIGMAHNRAENRLL